MKFHSILSLLSLLCNISIRIHLYLWYLLDPAMRSIGSLVSSQVKFLSKKYADLIAIINHAYTW